MIVLQFQGGINNNTPLESLVQTEKPAKVSVTTLLIYAAAVRISWPELTDGHSQHVLHGRLYLVSFEFCCLSRHSLQWRNDIRPIFVTYIQYIQCRRALANKESTLRLKREIKGTGSFIFSSLLILVVYCVRFAGVLGRPWAWVPHVALVFSSDLFVSHSPTVIALPFPLPVDSF